MCVPGLTVLLKQAFLPFGIASHDLVFFKTLGNGTFLEFDAGRVDAVPLVRRRHTLALKLSRRKVGAGVKRRRGVVVGGDRGMLGVTGWTIHSQDTSEKRGGSGFAGGVNSQQSILHGERGVSGNLSLLLMQYLKATKKQ